MDEKLLISKIKRKPRDGLIDAFEEFGPLVKAITVKILGNGSPGDVEECISDTFIKLWQSIDQYDERKGSLRPFIAAIARNTAIDRYRKINSDIISVPIEGLNAESGQDTEADVIKSINSDLVREAVNDLPEPDREIFYRRFFLSEKINDIADNMEIKNKRVEKRLSKGKRRLRDLLISKGINL
ncbi:MAG: sigma-70 family RNA polymerase sigma factor [Clostridiaceae bacterium]|jgi:RNA polymerase sigma-70 factor (ECF subfamily)|nr:sigma-70 family RNA polymerase sigma factor [Clostridiaceae bacterium]HQD31589.1 sigma-70 family RNA polymerase sigma factor [Clostridiales bacterium]